MTSLASSLQLPCGVSIPNRLAKAAMTEGLANDRGHATNEHVTLYRQWAEGGAGLLITGNVMVDRTHLERGGNVVLDDESGLEMLAAYAKAGTAADNQLWMQINHPGRQCARLVNPNPYSPSEVQLNMLGNFARPKELSDALIEDIIGRFVYTAELAKQAGFTGVQIHSAHGYLGSQFLSPITNQRQDRWGGALVNRARFLLTIVREVRKSLGDDFPVSVKLNSADFQKGGFTFEECQQVVSWLHQESVDLLEISGGNYEQLSFLGVEDDTRRDSTKQREAYFLDYAKAIRDVCDIPLMVTGGFRSRVGMLQALNDENIDLIGLARPLCVDANYAKQLINNEIDILPSFENDLTLGKSIFSANSSIPLFKVINMQGQAGWFYRQIIQMAKGQPALLNWGVFKAFYKHMFNDLKLVLARNKALKKDAKITQAVSDNSL